MGDKGTVCVTGASGFVGSWLVMRLLEQGYTVKATEACTTVRLPSPSAELCFNSKSCKLAHDLENMKKVKHLLDLPDAGTRLTLWKADLMEEGSFDEAIHGCVGVFHVATPMDFETKDPENEVIKPCVNGLLNILQSCVKADTVRRVVFTSSAGAVTMQRHRKSAYTEDDWSDVDFCREVKMTGWMYFTSKTLAEQAAFEFAKKHNLDFISIVSTLVVGEFIMPTMPPSMLTALALITRNSPHYFILNPIQFVHLDDLCLAHIFLFENPEAKGRYICSSHDITIVGLANMLRNKFPEYDIPTEFEGIDKISDTVHFSSKKLTDLGFEFKYSLEDMYEGSIKSCREKGLLPFATKKGYTKGNK